MKYERFYTDNMLQGIYISYNDDGSIANKQYYEKGNII